MSVLISLKRICTFRAGVILQVRTHTRILRVLSRTTRQKKMAKYGKASTLFIFVGFQIFLFALVLGPFMNQDKDDEPALIISAYCCYIVAFIISCLVYFDAFDRNKFLRFAVIILAALAGTAQCI